MVFKKFEEFILEKRGGSYRLFCDLDGVLVDFNKGFMDLEENAEKLSPKKYEAKHGKNAIWPVIDKLGESFWENLDWTKDGRELWDYIKQYDPIILSSPSSHPGCFSGKTKWVNRNLNIDQEAVTKPADFTKKTRFILATNKHDYVKPAKEILGKDPILIDDFVRKLEKWSKAGGIGILHNDSTDTIRVMEDIMNKRD